MKKDIDSCAARVIEAVNSRARALKQKVDEGVVLGGAMMGEASQEAYSAHKQLSNLVVTAPNLLASQDLHLLQVWGLLEAEANRLLALPPESITAACPLLSCRVETEVVIKAVDEGFHFPVVESVTCENTTHCLISQKQIIRVS